MFEGLLIVVILILTALIFTKCWRRRDRHARGCKCSECKMDRTPPPATVAIETKTTPEDQTINEHSEYFNIVSGAETCTDTGFAVNEFGAPGMDFKDWVMAQSVDPQTIKNHTEFVKDRTKNGEFMTGRTFTPDSHDSYDPIPWVGLRRPQAVPVGNPDQTPDVDYNLYSNKPGLVW